MKKFICTVCGYVYEGDEVQHLRKQRQQVDQLQKLQQKQHRQKLLQQQAILIQAKKSVLTHVKMVQVQEALSLNCLV